LTKIKEKKYYTRLNILEILFYKINLICVKLKNYLKFKYKQKN
jgi:hypothetical protein